MPIVLFTNPKGGTGKSTTAIHLGRSLNLASKSVLLIDADPQDSLVDWSTYTQVRMTISLHRQAALQESQNKSGTHTGRA